MVSLVNFRSFGELADEAPMRDHASQPATRHFVQQQQPPILESSNQKLGRQVDSGGDVGNNKNNNNSSNTHHMHHRHPHQRPHHQAQQSPGPEQLKQRPLNSFPSGAGAGLKSDAGPKEHFEIRWSNLNYQVEPKWYQQLGSSLFGGGGGGASARQPAVELARDELGGPATAAAPPKQRQAAASGARRTAHILNGLNGSVKSGQVTAVLGPSGAGKTSLLGCLTGKNKSGVSGAVEVISVNGGPGRLEPLSVCQIPQKDYLLNQLTVRENLWFASRLKHPTEGFDHDTNIERVVDLLKLDTCLDTKISKISGGQYKRVSIAQELLSNPDILILDEPTSGLDSLTCYKTVMVLRDLARLSPNPMAIIVTIHQPQREVFDLFNHVYILAVGGRCIYEGHPSQSIRTINESGTGLSFDSHMYNPASYLVEIASSEFGEKPIEVLVAHQREQFRLKSQAQDEHNLALDVVSGGGNGGGGGGQGALGSPAGTPGNARKRARQSPMVARFKSTLSSLTGGGGGGSSLVQISARAPPLHPGQVAYTNEAFVSSLTLNESPPPPPQLAASENNNNNINNNNNNSVNKSQQNLILSDALDLKGRLGAGLHAGLRGDRDTENEYDEGDFYLDSRLQTHKHNHQGHFLRHCHLLTKRSWLCLCKDPMLTTLRFSAHIIVPLLITIVYGNKVGKPNACPLYETDMDLIDYARRGAKRLLNLQDELRCTFENVGLYFLSIYAFTFSTMCLTSLSFPLNMHVLLKEVRNGWYSIPTYFIGKSLADFPLEFILPTLTLMITYPLTGQPSSYLEWRFFLATSVFVVTSLIAQTQGLIFGALFMNAMQAAVFVAPVSTTPLILLSGFLIRITQMPIYLQKLSAFSYFRYAIESLTIIRYGFGQCECDPAVVTGKPVSASGVPSQLRTMTNYWLSTFDAGNGGGGGGANDAAGDYGLADSTLANETATAIADFVTASTTTMAPDLVAAAANATAAAANEQPVDFFHDLTVLLARANSFGADIRTCKDLKPYPMIDFTLDDDRLYTWLAALVATLILSKIVNYLVVKYSVKWRL